ncbi:MAG: alternate F1F0 ATPase, F1 subunit alpha [Acidimicrobiia bacterium]|jgi:F-type H+-transporting ATPase subunit alpha
MTGPDTLQEFDSWHESLQRRLAGLEEALDDFRPRPTVEEIGHVLRVDGGIAEIAGLPGVRSEELVSFPAGRLGMAYDLAPDRVGVILLDEMVGISAGDQVRRTGLVMSAPVGRAMLGRVIDPTGRPLDDGGPLNVTERWPIERPAPAIMDRAPVDVPLQTGVKAIDALIPIGRGQRELILGDRQTGKTAIAVDTIINQRGQGVVCIYCAVGLRSSAVAKVVADLQDSGAMEYTAVVVATGDDPPGRQFIAPYAATTMAEFFMERGDDVLIVYDDLTRHGRAYRELSLLLRRPPGREAYPGDIFYIHSRLLERPTNLRRAGSMTALPIIETQAQNISAYIPTNLISITDGQIYLSPKLFQQGVLPAIDIGRSVSRVGGRAQKTAYRSVTGDLRLSYAQFEELERFSRYGARLERDKESALERGRRVREVLKQPRYEPMSLEEQVAVLVAVTAGAFDHMPVSDVERVSRRIAREMVSRHPEIFTGVTEGEELSEDQLAELRSTAHRIAGARP